MVRVTTWNVNGIRNPFAYEPWRKTRTFSAMFDILEADIVIMQELKIQRKDLTDDMVLLPGWDCFFSLPRHKKGYSGVAIYTRQSVCAPIRAEEGLLGVLCPPASPTPYNHLPADTSIGGHPTPYKDLPPDASIGGYPTPAQVAELGVDPLALDAEGRCVVLEFPAFVLFGVYSPANSNGLRDDFRYAFITALDTRIRNLNKMGKRVILTGDLNVSREEFDTAKADEAMRQEGITREEYLNMPNRRIFNQLLENGKVPGERDKGREMPVLWDICREFHPTRQGMFTHWEQKINARPGNYGSRIDYILCSIEMKTWFSDSNIQEGLMGSDHCPVYAVIKDIVDCDGDPVHALDIMNPPGVYENGVRLRDFDSSKDLLTFSGKLLPEFTKRRNIKDMFAKKITPPETSLIKEDSSASQTTSNESQTTSSETFTANNVPPSTAPSDKILVTRSPMNSPEKRRASRTTIAKQVKRSKSNSSAIASQPLAKGQKSLKGFFQAKSAEPKPSSIPTSTTSISTTDGDVTEGPPTSQLTPASPSTTEEIIIDPQQSKDSWNKLFSKKPPPCCEGHGEHCITLTTKKPGVNCGRHFWICPRPLGPSGQKETGTQWRCATFIWASDWNSSGAKT